MRRLMFAVDGIQAVCIFLAVSNSFTSGSLSCTTSVASHSKNDFLAYGKDKDNEVLYLRLAFLNETHNLPFRGDVSLIYDPLGWAWTETEQGKAILSLPYDSDILSCTTLSRETRHMAFDIFSQPPGCFARGSSEWQYEHLVGLLAKAAKDSSFNSSICHRFVEEGAKSTRVIYQSTTSTGLPRIRYKCCMVGLPDRDCKMMVTPNKALSFIMTLLWLVSCVAAFFTPLLIRYLPSSGIETKTGCTNNLPFELNSCADQGDVGDENISSPDENGVESDETSVRRPYQDEYISFDNSTPLKSLLEVDPCLFFSLGFFPRFSRFLLFFIIVPGVLSTALIAYSVVLKHDINLQKHAGIKTDLIQMCLNPDSFLIFRIAGYVFSCVLLCIPLSLTAVVDESVLLVGSLQAEESCCIICRALQRPPNKDLVGHQLLYDNMLSHLKFLFSVSFWKVLWSFSFFPSRWLLHFLVYGKGLSLAHAWQMQDQTEDFNVAVPSCCVRVLGIFLWVLSSPIWLITALFIACFVIFLMTPVGYFYACICFVPLVFLLEKLGNNLCTWLIFFVCFLINVSSALFLIEIITFSWSFILKVLGFTLMGLIVGIDYYIPYIVYAVAVCYYVENFWRSLNDRYLKLKVLLFDECMKQQTNLIEARTSGCQSLGLVIKHGKTKMPMIPKQLYQAICREQIPFKKAVSSSLFNLLMIILFLSFAFASIMAFGKWAKLPSLTEASVTAVLSTLPKLLRYQGKHAGNSMLKEKKLLYSIEVTVAQFVNQM